MTKIKDPSNLAQESQHFSQNKIIKFQFYRQNKCNLINIIGPDLKDKISETFLNFFDIDFTQVSFATF